MNKTLIAVVLAGLLVAPAMAQKMVGAGKCKICHAKEDVGNQYGKWAASKHASAFKVLPSSEQSNPKCLICHTTGGGVKNEEGVSCEACHGPGEKYKAKEVHATDRAAALAAGMVDTKAQGEAVCKKCHVPERDGNKNPNFKGFDYKKFKDKIAHPRPKK